MDYESIISYYSMNTTTNRGDWTAKQKFMIRFGLCISALSLPLHGYFNTFDVDLSIQSSSE